MHCLNLRYFQEKEVLLRYFRHLPAAEQLGHSGSLLVRHYQSETHYRSAFVEI